MLKIEKGDPQSLSFHAQDHLGSPRIITNENGVVTSRKDFMAYGEEAASANRVSGSGGNGYDPAGTRKDYTGYEKDSETGLEYAQARYYNPTHGRYTSIDPMTASATIKNPQTFNRYSYVLNSPYKFVDPLGLISQNSGACAGWCNNSDSHAFGSVGALTADKGVVARSPAETGPGSEGLVQMHFIHALKNVAIQKTAGNERNGPCPKAVRSGLPDRYVHY